MSTTPQPLVPDYADAWVGGVVPALLGFTAADWLPEAVTGARAVVLVVLDGLGTALLGRGQTPTIDALPGRTIHAPIPSTTATALTSLTTGATPGEHGIMGFRMWVGGTVLASLSWRAGGRGEPTPEPVDVQPIAPFMGENVPVVTRSAFARSGFSAAHLRGATQHGWTTTAVLVEHVVAQVRAGARFVWAYDDGVDKVAHEHGTLDGFCARQLGDADRLVADLLDALDGDVAVCVTADHGHLDVPRDGVISLEPIADRVARIAGEGRFRTLWARRGDVDGLVAAAEELADGSAWIVTREEAAAEGWFGPRPTRAALSRLGDVIVAPHQAVAFIDPGWSREGDLLSFHGSLTPAEVEVPLRAARGRA